MKTIFDKINFNLLFKIAILISITYFLYVLTLIATHLKNNEDVGRFQYHNQEFLYMDTKTGTTKHIIVE